jgi:hypothetical protein
MVSLFDEMDQAAREICFGSAWLFDCQIEFRQLQKARYPEMSEREWLDLFRLWLEHHWAKMDRRVAALLAEGNALHCERALLPLEQRAAIDDRLKAIAFEMADAVVPRLPPATATWVSDSET